MVQEVSAYPGSQGILELTPDPAEQSEGQGPGRPTASRWPRGTLLLLDAPLSS